MHAALPSALEVELKDLISTRDDASEANCLLETGGPYFHHVGSPGITRYPTIHMSTSSVQTQIARLRPSVIFAPQMNKWFLAGAAIGLLAAIVLWHPWPLMIAFFLGFVGFSEQRAGPNLLSAILAYDCDDPTEGTVSVEITSWSDSETYHAIVSEIGHSDWKYQFIPQGWQR